MLAENTDNHHDHTHWTSATNRDMHIYGWLLRPHLHIAGYLEKRIFPL